MRLVLLRSDLLQSELDLLAAMMVTDDGMSISDKLVAKTLTMFIEMLADCDDEILDELINLFGEAVVIDLVDSLTSGFGRLQQRTGVDILKSSKVVLDVVHNVLAIAVKN